MHDSENIPPTSRLDRDRSLVEQRIQQQQHQYQQGHMTTYYVLISCFADESPATIVPVSAPVDQAIPALMAWPTHLRFRARQPPQDMQDDVSMRPFFKRYRAYFGIWDPPFHNLYPYNMRAQYMLPGADIAIHDGCRGNVVVTGPDGKGVTHTEASFLVMTMCRANSPTLHQPTYTTTSGTEEVDDESWSSVDYEDVTMTEHDLTAPMYMGKTDDNVLPSSPPTLRLQDIWADEL